VKRNHLVILIIVAALVLIAWFAAYNHIRHRQAIHQATLVRDSGGAAITLQQSPGEDAPLQLVNKPAPAFTLVDLNGKKVSLSDYRGKAVLINFWATTCGPCKIEIPWFVDLHNQYASQGFEILGLSYDSIDDTDKSAAAKDKEEISAFVSKMHMNYPVVTGGENVAQAYGGVDGLPSSFFVDRQGVVVAQTMGLHPREEIESDIKKALAAKAITTGSM
jgi:peroxiredoxin